MEEKKRFCVIGDPVAHSKSPQLHTAMLAALGENAEYLCKPVTAGELPAFLQAARRGEWQGFNATMPHKETLVPYMDVLDETARRCGAVNTVCIRAGKLYGYNTDGGGFCRALAQMGVTPAGKQIVLLGAGGAAKSVALALCGGGASHITVCNRTPERAQALASCNDIMSTETMEPADLKRAVSRCDLLVNCTSLGMAGGGGQFESLDFLQVLPEGAPVCDLIYHPPETALLSAACALGHPTMNGLPLLLNQAILALEHFLNRELDGEKLLPLLHAELEK